jgi:hypothetical protein
LHAGVLLQLYNFQNMILRIKVSEETWNEEQRIKVRECVGRSKACHKRQVLLLGIAGCGRGAAGMVHHVLQCQHWWLDCFLIAHLQQCAVQHPEV